MILRDLTMCGTLFAILATAPLGAAADPVDIANSLRRQGCGTLPAVDRPLTPRAQLDEAAQRVSRGEKLETATSASGYRAKRSSSIRISTTQGDDGVVRMLARRFCAIVADPGLHDIGAYRRGDETWMVLAAPLSVQGADDAAAVNRRVVELINEARSAARKCGRKKLPAATKLRQVAALDSAALAHAQDMAAQDFMGHEGSDGSMPADRVTRADYAWRSVAENVAAGQTSAEEVVDTWLESPGHCANLMDPRYIETGVAHAVNPNGKKGTYWVQVFATTE
jgi:uncharacterized protein YkwD